VNQRERLPQRLDEVLCHQTHQSDSRLEIRFLLTFDDGPHANTRKVLRQLARNPVQPDIKAIFFVQTRYPKGGGSVEGRSLLHLEHAEGHMLGLHTGTPRGHVSHTRMAPDDLDRSLQDGKDDLDRITGRKTILVRPPYWRFNPSTLLRYGRHGLHMVLSDIKAFDGINWGIHMLKRWSFRSQLARVRTKFLRGNLPIVNHTLPVVVTFHDTNAFTADHLSDYLSLLVEESHRLGFPLHRKPFLDGHRDILEAGLLRAAFPASVTHKKSLFAEAQ